MLGHEVNLTGAGRTDTGVHARNFYAHFDSEQQALAQNKELVYKLNGYIPADIAIYNIYRVHADAHARFDATERTYKYYLSPHKELFATDTCWQYYRKLDLSAMNQAAALLLQYSDFTSFSKLHTQVKTNLCHIKMAEWSIDSGFYVFTITANRFLRNMVRSIVGTLIEVGNDKRSIHEFQTLIEKKDRNLAGPSAPAKGLFLEQILYPYLIQ